MAYIAHVTGSSAAIKESGSSVISPVSHSTMTLYFDTIPTKMDEN